MIYVGIDIAKNKHFASIVNSDGEVIEDAFSFLNDASGFKLLLSKISFFSKDKLTIGLESTAHYAENLVSFLFQLGYKVCIINPIQTSALRKGNIRPAKNDKIDTMIIVKALILNDYLPISSRDIDIIELKSSCHQRDFLVKERSMFKIKLTAVLDVVFPELQYFFKSGIHISACYELLKIAVAPKDIAELHLTKLSNLLCKTSKGHFKKEKAIQLKELATFSVGTENSALYLNVIQYIENIELLNRQIKNIEELITLKMKKINSVIMTVPGISEVTAATILSEIGNVQKFSHSKKIVAFAGLDPRVYQSGNFYAPRTRMSKRGSKLLRYSLILAAHNIVLNDELFKTYYDLKISQGRRHYNALGHVATKLIRVLFKILKEDIPYQKI